MQLIGFTGISVIFALGIAHYIIYAIKTAKSKNSIKYKKPVYKDGYLQFNHVVKRK